MIKLICVRKIKFVKIREIRRLIESNLRRDN